MTAPVGSGSRQAPALALARAWYGVLGAAVLALTGGHAYAGVTGSARFDPPIVATGLVVGLLTLAAAVWARSGGRRRSFVVWLGIVAGLAPLLWLFWVAVQTTSPDAIALAGAPAALGSFAAVRIARARLAGGVGAT